MKVAIVGSRTVSYRNYQRVRYALTKWFPQATAIVSGGARGADAIGKRIGEELGLELIIFPADWDRHGKAAGFMRNTDIAQACDVCIAVVDKPLRESRGTRDTVLKARHMGKRVIVVYAAPDGSEFRVTAE